MPLAIGQILNNRYRIDALLGQGGFGAVYCVLDVNLNRPRALKENLDTSPEAQRQFWHEAAILADLVHPNLPRVLDYFSIPGYGQYLVMDYVEGQDLQAVLDGIGGALPEASVTVWMAQVCDALGYLHQQTLPIIHRDIKPANIKITPSGQAVLVDFGIAKLYDAALKTTLGAKAVTPGYSPPEQYGQGKTDVRSDIYALGATMYALLTSQEPVESVTRFTGATLKPPRALNPAISPQAESVVLKAMQLAPEARYQNAGEFKAALTKRLPNLVLSKSQIAILAGVFVLSVFILAVAGLLFVYHDQGVVVMATVTPAASATRAAAIAQPTNASSPTATTSSGVGATVTPVSTATPVPTATKLTAVDTPASRHTPTALPSTQQACPGGQVWSGTECVCPADKPDWLNGQCVAKGSGGSGGEQPTPPNTRP